MSKSYTGGCHCGAVRYELQAEITQAISCNCSNCAKVGYLLAFIPESQFTLLSGEESLTDYLFHKKIIHHLFCKICGVHSFGRGKGPDGADTVAINLRCLDDLDPSSLPVHFFDGKSR
jgi:hypothetical protein